MSTEHTKTPWRVEGRRVMALKEKSVCELPCGGLVFGKIDFANARLIVRAVNSFEAMKEALESVRAFGLDGSQSSRETQALYDRIDAALSPARGEG